MAENNNQFDPTAFVQAQAEQAAKAGQNTVPQAPLASAPVVEKAPQAQGNPLASFFRQPKIHISLPSKGKFWPQGSLETPQTGEHPVYAMTARDELLFKTPDALMNGSAIIEVIQSCIPSIKNAWDMPSLDVDAVLTAIRMATYGVDMDVTATCPKCNHQSDKSVDLRGILDGLNSTSFATTVEVGDNMLVHLRPMTYKEITGTALKTFEHQRIFSIINNDEIDDQQKMKLFNESFIKLTDLTLATAVQCVVKIESSAGTTDNPEYIKEFLEKADKSVFNAINDSVNKSQESGRMASFKTTCDAENCDHEWDVKLTLDQADFFGQGFRS